MTPHKKSRFQYMIFLKFILVFRQFRDIRNNESFQL